MRSRQERGVNEVNPRRHSAAGSLAAIPSGAAVPVQELQERYKTADLTDLELQKELSHYLSVMGYVQAIEGLRERAEPRLRALNTEMRERHRRKQQDGHGPKKAAGRTQGEPVIDAADFDRIERAQTCLQRARAGTSEAGDPGLAGELTHHLDMVLRVITGIRVMSGELDDVHLAVTPPSAVSSGRKLQAAQVGSKPKARKA
jgi:hypothetical protein